MSMGNSTLKCCHFWGDYIVTSLVCLFVKMFDDIGLGQC